MAFQAYNVQVLPLDTQRVHEVGITGYKKLLNKLSGNLTAAVKEKRLLTYCFPLVNETFFCPFTIQLTDKYAHGTFVKFHKADNIQDLYTQEELYVSSGNATPISNAYFFRFIFDFDLHRLFIEELSGRLPSPAYMEKALNSFFGPIVAESFKEYTLTVNLISERKRLATVLREAEGFSRIQVRLTFPNSPGILPDVLQEVKDRNIHKIECVIAAAPGATIPQPTPYMEAMLQHVSDYGDATISYFKKLKTKAGNVLKKARYATKKFPKRIFVRQHRDESDEALLVRVMKNSTEGE